MNLYSFNFKKCENIFQYELKKKTKMSIHCEHFAPYHETMRFESKVSDLVGR